MPAVGTDALAFDITTEDHNSHVSAVGTDALAFDITSKDLEIYKPAAGTDALAFDITAEDLGSLVLTDVMDKPAFRLPS